MKGVADNQQGNSKKLRPYTPSRSPTELFHVVSVSTTTNESEPLLTRLLLQIASLLKIWCMIKLRSFIHVCGKKRTCTKTSDECPPFMAHLPSMMMTGTPLMPIARALSYSWLTSVSISLEFRKVTACWRLSNVAAETKGKKVFH